MDPFLGEIRAVAFKSVPQGWALCQGQLLPIRQNAALYSLLSTTYGGDGRTTFALPNLQGRLVVQAGQGLGLSSYQLGQQAGTETVALNLTQLPAHAHGLTGLTVGVSSTEANSSSPASNLPAANNDAAHYNSGAGVQLAAGAVTGTLQAVGEGAAHTNLMPYLTLNYIIALAGIFPPRP